MPYPVPSLAETRAFIVALGRSLFQRLNFSVRSYHGKWSTYLAGAVSQLHAHVDSAQRDLHPLTAGDGKPIADWGDALQVRRGDATPARKSAAGRVRGNAAATVDPGTQLRNPKSGLLYQVANATTVTIPGVGGVDPDSFVDVDIAGVDTGSQTKMEAGDSLIFVMAPPGIEPEVVLQLDLDEDGFDREQFGSYRAHVLGALRATPSGGNQGDFATWIEQALSSVRGYSYPNRAGRGTIDLVGLHPGSGSDRSLTAQEQATVLAYVRSKAGFQITGDGGGLRVLDTVADPQRVEILVTPSGVPAYQFDFTGSFTVASYNATTRELTFAGGVLPPALRAGGRIVLVGSVGGSGVSAQDGREYRVEAISAADKVILETSPPVNPAATDLIYSGGPLVSPIRDAIVAHLSGELVYAGRGQEPIAESVAFPEDPTGESVIGLDVLADGIGPANPAGKYNDTVSWVGAILRANLMKIAAYKAGVINVNVVTPASDYEATDDAFPNDAQIHYITPGVIIVRSA